jgi:hypothetical protein
MTDDKADETIEGLETTETATTDDRADETIEGSETTEEATTDDKADETIEGSETTEVDLANRNTTTGHAQSATTQTLHAEPCATGAKNHVLLEVEEANVEAMADRTIEEAMTTEVDNGRSVAPSMTTIGHVQSATIRISHSETYVTDARSLGLVAAVAVAAVVDRETTTDDKADETITSAPLTAATDDKADGTIEDTGATETVATDDKADETTTSAPPTVATDDKADETTEGSETTEMAATDDKADETTEGSETTEMAATDDRADRTTEDSETIEMAATDDRAKETTVDSAVVGVNETVVAKATTVHPVGVGNEMDALSEVLPTTTSVEPRASDRAMPTIDHLEISELHANLNEKTSERMWPRERRITLPQRS